MSPSLNLRGLGWALTLTLAIGCYLPGYGQQVPGGGELEQLNANILNAEFTPAATGQWRLLHSGRPARFGHQAVWTGKEMFILGGPQSSFTLLSPEFDGRYDPRTDNWSPVSSIGAYGSTAVWTGTEILVWGGYPVGASNGYNPTSRIRRRLSSVGAPEFRSGHSMVWTGREMIIWGGHDGRELVNTGARYNPADDKWTPMAINPALIRRSSHSAVWTGTEMIVWGGAW